MPTITRSDGSAVTDQTEAAGIVAALGLGVAHLALPVLPELAAVLDSERLAPRHAVPLLDRLAPLLPKDHAGKDIIALFPLTEGLAGILAAFHRCHVHDDDEVRLILAGGGVFGFVLPDGEQVEIAVQAGDLIAVPAGTEHWFRLDPRATIVAVRLFGANPDWRARYTGTPIRFLDRAS
jgi:1,2-dihydroxy-3-keto-5-methylthiopentene dioxygenase